MPVKVKYGICAMRVVIFLATSIRREVMVRNVCKGNVDDIRKSVYEFAICSKGA